jgi:hypothetical protein
LDYSENSLTLSDNYSLYLILSRKKIPGAFLLLFGLCWLQADAQTVFWSEDFGTGCNQATLASAYTGVNGTWTTTFTGVQGAKGNKWFVSSTEADMGQGNCGDGCLNTLTLSNRTLHVGSPAIFLICGAPGDCGAAYNAGGNGATNVRAESPIINCTGQTTITLTYNYLLNGQALLDNGTVYYSPDGGTTWVLLDSPSKSLCCATLGGPPGVCDELFYAQGLWAQRSVALPAACNNNATVKLGFLWINNADNTGIDPSFAVDSLALSTTVMLPIDLVHFDALAENNAVDLFWQTNSETNNNFFTVERTRDGSEFSEVGIVSGSGTTSLPHSYKMTDTGPASGTSYYRLKQTDFNGNYTYSALRPVVVNAFKTDLHVGNFENPGNGQFFFDVSSSVNANLFLQLTDVNGRILWSKTTTASDRLTRFNGTVNPYREGVYFLKVSDGFNQVVRKLFF